ncbi:hypothetical protein F7P73_05195 [Acinetobacter bohemicus]|jgi:hypothetical protein|uniref:Uncharacterized protein n=1 Tax=Acinetobacter bohemicus TaxID=1435036 RepID=A0A1I6QIT0_9GAMM|nr:hypothetical protein [Acinetobacter bohemicus]KAB0653906.1 hypothetical protein F7P73_05195 [Acinetobacter bohemicus]SFS52334.1 hypothetical protein SAMN05444586_100475 [Acinetobacter bohemicus]
MTNTVENQSTDSSDQNKSNSNNKEENLVPEIINGPKLETSKEVKHLGRFRFTDSKNGKIQKIK